MNIQYKENFTPDLNVLIELYKSVGWGHASCPNATYAAIQNSSFVVTAWEGDNLVGLGRAISDGTITAYFPDLLIKPDWQGKGIGTQIMTRLLAKYGDMHNQVLVAEDDKAREFYKKQGFNEEKYALATHKPFPNED